MNINRACGLARPGRARRPARVRAPARRRAQRAGRVSPSLFVSPLPPGSPHLCQSTYLGRPSPEIEITDPPLEGAEEIVVGGWWFSFSNFFFPPRWPRGKEEIMSRGSLGSRNSLEVAWVAASSRQLRNHGPERELRPSPARPRAVPTQPRRGPRKTAASSGTLAGAQGQPRPPRVTQPALAASQAGFLVLFFFYFGVGGRGSRRVFGRYYPILVSRKENFP